MSASHLDIEVPVTLAPAQRLDRFLSEHRKVGELGVSRSRLQRLIKDGDILVNGKKVVPRFALHGGENICIPLVAASADPNAFVTPVAEDIPLDILFEDKHLIVVNKPIGLVVHPGAGHTTGTLVNALLHHCNGRLATLDGTVDIERPGIVHRLDRDTSGCMVAAKTDLAHRSLVEQFAQRLTSKVYHCIVAGRPSEPEGTIRTHIGRHPVQRQRMSNVEPPAGKSAHTDYRTVAGGNLPNHSCWTHIECTLHTGRTHQIRVNMKESLRCPILGDPIYGNPKRDPIKTGRLMLHAHQLGFRHPETKEEMKFTAELPQAFERFSG